MRIENSKDDSKDTFEVEEITNKLQECFINGFQYDSEDIQIRLNLNELNPESQMALKNIIAYGNKLMMELGTDPFGVTEALASKVKATQEFLTSILTQKTLDPKVLKEAHEHFECQDKNRGTGFYCIHSLIAKKWYRDPKGHKHLVKSEMGKHVHNFYEAVSKLKK